MNLNDVQNLIGQPRSEILEYRAVLPSSRVLAETICGFANTVGGYLILGVSESQEINGLSGDFKTEAILQKAISLVSPQPQIQSDFISFKGKRLFVIVTQKSETDLRVDGKKYVREGEITKLSDATELNFSTDGVVYQNKRESMDKKNKDSGITYNEYDINLTRSYDELVKLLQGITESKTGISKEDYLIRIKEGIESYAIFHKLGSLQGPLPIIVKYPAYNYHAHLAFQLMTFDVNKISGLLDFQHANFLGLDRFQKTVEHGVYNWIKQNSPFDNEVRLQKIMEWVEKRKEVEPNNSKLAKDIGTKILQTFKKANADVGEIVMIQAIHEIYHKSPPSEKKVFNDVFLGMVHEGIIGYDDGEPNFIRLGDWGYSRIYEAHESVEEVRKEKSSNLPTVVILTAIGEEYAAVRAHLVNPKPWKKDTVIFEQGVFEHEGIEIARVFIRECGAKNANAAQETQRALTYHKPDCILFVGIAGSRKPHDFRIGDVIFPEKVHYYEGGKSELGGFRPRSDDVRPTFALYEIAKLERHKADWKNLIKSKLDYEVGANLGVIASGEQVVEHYDSEVGKVLSMYNGDSACIEMEGYGFLNTIQRQGGEFAIDYAGVIRGVSDVLEQEKITSNQNAGEDRRPAGAKKLASETAAAFAYWLIVKVFEETVN